MTSRAAVVAVAVLALVGCTVGDSDSDSSGPSSSPTSEGAGSMTTPPSSDPAVATLPIGSGGEAIGPLGSAELRVETDAGTVQIGSGSVPERLASGFPLPPDFVVLLSSETATDLGVSGTTELAVDELVELYESELPEAGYVIVSVDRRGSDFAVFEFQNADGLGQVAISAASGSGGSTVIVAFGDGDGQEAQLEN